MDSEKRENAYWTAPYLFGVLLAVVLRVGILSRWIIVKGWENFPHNEGGILLMPNHPSLFEPLLMIALFHKAYLRHPERLGPHTWADRTNYTEHDGWSKFNKRLLSIVRPTKDWSPEQIAEAKQTNLVTMKRSVEILRALGNIIIFAEGGRTGSIEDPSELIMSPNGNKIRPFVDGASLVAIRSRPKIVPVWVRIIWGRKFQIRKRTFWVPKRVYISIGEVMTVQEGERREELTTRIQTALLTLADAS